MANAPVVDATFAHESAVVQHIGGGGHPIADVEAYDTFAGTFDFLLQARIPPDVVNVGGDADPFVTDLVEHVVALPDGIHCATAVGIHGVEWFDRKLDADLAGVFDQASDALGNVLTVFGEAELGLGTADEDDLWCTHGRRFIQSFDVVVKGGLFLGAVEIRVESTADE